VREFLETQVFQVPRGRRLSVFLEPALDTGFPDLVAVLWRVSGLPASPAERAALMCDDIRLLYWLGMHAWFELEELWRLYSRQIADNLDRLEAAGLLLRGRRKVRTRAMRDIFFVERIVSIEAKTATTRRLMVQARNNTWFSSESYALVPVRRPTSSTLTRAADLGIGLLGQVDQQTLMFSRAAAQPVPSSYGSWLFNEWVWRLSSSGQPPDGGERELRWP